MNYKENIERTKQGFEESFRVGAYYNKQTRDDMHLVLILRCIQVEPGMKILDLGTGSGYLAFPFADKYKQAEVIGLDIVEKTLDYIDGFETSIRFPRKKDTALEFDDITSRHQKAVISGYEVEIIEDEIWISERVNNLLFKKNK